MKTKDLNIIREEEELRIGYYSQQLKILFYENQRFKHYQRRRGFG